MLQEHIGGLFVNTSPFMRKCAYCGAAATGMDAIGLPACWDHQGEADEYFEQRMDRSPHEDTYLHCDEHGDAWAPGCKRCEACSQHHYGMPVSDFLASPASEITIFTIDKRQ